MLLQKDGNLTNIPASSYYWLWINKYFVLINCKIKKVWAKVKSLSVLGLNTGDTWYESPVESGQGWAIQSVTARETKVPSSTNK